MYERNTTLTIGLDLGDKINTYAILEDTGEFIEESTVTNNMTCMRAFFRKYTQAKVVIETSTHSPWISHLAETMNLQVLVANSRKLAPIYNNPRKCDQYDAQMLARLGRFEPALLAPITHRGIEAQAHLAVLKARDQLVNCRTKLINNVRSQVKSFGERLEDCSAESFHKKAAGQLPQLLRPALEPLLLVIAGTTNTIRAYDKHIGIIADQHYPETKRLQQVKGVGAITSLAYVLTLEDPSRFPRARIVGAWVGLVPKREQSGENDPNLSITKAGNKYLRRLLVEASRYILGRFGPDCDLRRFGWRLLGLPPDAAYQRFKEKSLSARNRATVAVARKLSVLLRVLWTSSTPYDPLHNSA